MRRAAVLFLLVAGGAAAQAPSAFDGTWDVTVACTNAADGALGYTLRFPARVEAGLLVGDYRGDGTLHLEGPIRPDGTARLRAVGTTGDPNRAVGRVPRQSDYRYTVEARFAGNSGTGRRLETRPCDLTFRRR
ncbi:hypothetical protein [Falsiroseomonas sp. HW251]|uniref:hypothetical protein n=1 Tax=Falsiroseomonas sp. HW251 TaxID=3390998 RepID=UPI003D320BB9